MTTNLDYTIEIPEDAQSWLSLAPETRALREDTIVFEVTANEGMQRYTTVALKDEQGKILQTIIFRQLGTCTEVHVETKGELENELAGYDYANIESLKITGVLNDVDFLFIYRMMPNLKNLDIAEVNITALPIQAFYKSTNVENLILPNTLITIGEEMFYQSKLKTVVIPANATTIGNSAFEQCASLISIDIPANVETIGTAVFWGCSSLTTVTFEKGSQLKTIGGGSSSYYGAFSYCSSLTSIEIPASVETIKASAFFVLTSDIFNQTLQYLQRRYITNGSTNERFMRLRLRNNDDTTSIQRVLLGLTNNSCDIIKAIIMIIYRYRNNLFHGEKAIASLPMQKDNFINANKFLIACLEATK